MPVYRDPQVNIYVRDVDRMTRFYTEVLGFTQTYRYPEEGKPEHSEVRLGGLLLGLGSIEAAKKIHGIDVEGKENPTEVVLWVDDCREAYAHLLANGATPVREPVLFMGRLLGAWVTDPEGNPVHIVQDITARQ